MTHIHPRTAAKLKLSRRGSIVVLAAVFLVLMLGFIALSVDIGYLGLPGHGVLK